MGEAERRFSNINVFFDLAISLRVSLVQFSESDAPNIFGLVAQHVQLCNFEQPSLFDFSMLGGNASVMS